MFLGKTISWQNFHEWKLIPLSLTPDVLEASFKIRTNLDIIKCPLKMFLLLYSEMLTGWSEYFSFFISILSTNTSQFLWFNINIKNLFESSGNKKNVG